jgi:putative membrane protein
MHPLTVWLALSYALWFWHLPALYAWALQNEGVHTAEHLSFLIISLAFWTIVIEPYG